MNIAHQLIGSQVRVLAVDLFEVAVPAIIRATDDGYTALLLEFVPPVQADGVKYKFAVARARLARDDLETLLRDGKIGCGLICIPPNRYDHNKPFDVSWWRGGGSAIGDVTLHNRAQSGTHNRGQTTDNF